MTHPLRAAAIGVIASLSIALPVVAQSPTPSAAPDGGPRALAEAVAFAPLGTDLLLFTDWAAMKAFHGLDDLTSETPIDERLDALMGLTQEEAPFAGFGVSHLATHAEDWGWDTSDLEWESSYSVDGPPVAVLRFRDGFDMAPVLARYDEREFTTEAYDDATIRSHAMDLAADWVRTTDFGILNTAFLDDGRTLVLSSSAEGVKAALDARHVQTFRASPASVVAERLEQPFSAAIDLALGSCAAYDPRLTEGPDGPNAALLDQAGPLGDWEAMGVGTDRDASGAATGRFAFAYVDPGQASADLAGRQLLATDGISVRTGQPYASSVLRVGDATADGAVLVLDVTPVEGRSRRLQQAVYARDLAFATCG